MPFKKYIFLTVKFKENRYRDSKKTFYFRKLFFKDFASKNVGTPVTILSGSKYIYVYYYI